MKRALTIAVLLGALGCAPSGVQQPGETCVVLPDQPSPSDIRQTFDAFDRWIDASVRTPGAVFRVLRLGRTRTAVQTEFAEVIPQSWGAPNAVANRMAFVVRSRERVRTQIEQRGAERSNVTVPQRSRVTVNVLPELDSRGVHWTWTEKPAMHEAVLCDVSISGDGSACTPASLFQSYDAWAAGAAHVGSTFRVWIIGTSIDTTERAFAVDTPDLPMADRIAFLLSARNELAGVFTHLPARAGSAISGAVTVAFADLAQRGGAKSLLILSDLRETSEVFAFERSVPTPEEFVRWLRTEELVPNCSGIEISVCGLHYASTAGEPPFDARRGAQVRSVWTRAFAAMHPRTLRVCGACDADAFKQTEVSR